MNAKNKLKMLSRIGKQDDKVTPELLLLVVHLLEIANRRLSWILVCQLLLTGMAAWVWFLGFR